MVYNIKANFELDSELVLPDKGETFFLGYVIDGDLFKVFVLDALARLEEVYLEADFDLLGEGSLREHRLYLRDDRAGHHSTCKTINLY